MVICYNYTPESFDLLRLQFDSLVVDENALPLVRLRLPPHPYLRGKLHYHLFFDTLQQYTRRLRSASFHTEWDSKFNGMRVSNL